MGYYVGTQLSFSTNSLRRLKEVVNKTLADKYTVFTTEQRQDFDDSYTKMMLEQIAENTEKYIHYGNKGDMFIWGGVWNYYSAEIEIPYLKKFFENCWNYEDNIENIMFDFEKALLLVNPEQSEKSFIYEFSFDENIKQVIVRKTESDLNWNQY